MIHHNVCWYWKLNQKQKRRMDEFSKQYEHIDPYYENLY